jgi:hypothetical protein
MGKKVQNRPSDKGIIFGLEIWGAIFLKIAPSSLVRFFRAF